MSGDVTIKVEGLKELERALIAISDSAPGIIAQALRDPMQRVLADAKALAPQPGTGTATGLLRDSLELTPVRRASARRASMADTLSEVGIRIRKIKILQRAAYTNKGTKNKIANPRYYWHLVEFGTSHSAAKPYLRPAFDQNTEHLIGQFKSIAADKIEKTRERFARSRKRRRG